MIVQVQQRDTLSSIAAEYHTTVDRIRQQNRLSDDTVWVGMRLLVDGYVLRCLTPDQTLEMLCNELCVPISCATLLADGRTIKICV